MLLGAVWHVPDGSFWQGLELAADRINGEGGLLGRPLHIVARTDGSSLSAGMAIAEEFAATLRQRLDMESRIVSPYNGRVLRRNVQLFDVVTPGSPVLSIEQIGESVRDLEAILYVSADERHLIAPGMDVHISPATAPKERYGLLEGAVISVAPLPSSIDDIAAAVGSRELAMHLAGDTAPVEVRAVLHTDRSTPSGYRWSSKEGPPFPLMSGTVCTASITVSQRRPIGLIIPGL